MRHSLADNIFKTLLPIMLGTALYAFGLHYFIIPNQLMEGGVTGISILLSYAFDVPTSVSTLLFNIPLFILGWRVLGRKSMMFTIFGTLSFTFFLWLMETIIDKQYIQPFYTEHDYILASLYAGVSVGGGLGIVFRAGGTTGGSDIIARILQKKRGFSMGQVILFFDALIIGLSLLYIPLERVLYTLVTVFIGSKIIDFIQEGAYAAKAFTIITNHGEKIADTITKDMDRGVTIIPATGAYSKQAKEVLYCVVSRQEIRRVKEIVHEIDHSAFVIINDVHDVLGEGFKGNSGH
ncbi:membrane protein [Paenibacillus swuensis]|uniref:Membrane protein n=1 Tax=Paenibacillus swuensis TaxID=1178515 RepID=A0A172TLN8_9BACL|nr:YitT family protein [Paenibacillus swuensis]ANE47948.1 membrane protein [Paenibacillus swuensis]